MCVHLLLCILVLCGTLVEFNLYFWFQWLSPQNRVINPAMSGGYPQQGYQSRPPSDWAPPAPMQQAGYGYVQPGAYSGPSPQYNMPQ